MTKHSITTNPTSVVVLPIRSDAEVDTKAKEIRAFDELIAEYLAVTAAWRRGVADEESEALSDKQCDLIWQIIRTPAPMPSRMNDKLELLRELIESNWTDCRSQALIESIRNDIVRE